MGLNFPPGTSYDSISSWCTCYWKESVACSQHRHLLEMPLANVWNSVVWWPAPAVLALTNRDGRILKVCRTDRLAGSMSSGRDNLREKNGRELKEEGIKYWPLLCAGNSCPCVHLSVYEIVHINTGLELWLSGRMLSYQAGGLMPTISLTREDMQTYTHIHRYMHIHIGF